MPMQDKDKLRRIRDAVSLIFEVEQDLRAEGVNLTGLDAGRVLNAAHYGYDARISLRHIEAMLVKRMGEG